MERKDVQGSDTALNATLTVDTRHYTFVETHKTSSSRSEPKYKIIPK